MKHQVYIILGSNIGNKLGYLEKAKYLIDEHVGVINDSSPIYRTEPWGVVDQSEYFNQVILVTTKLNGKKLIEKTLEIESMMGRVRRKKWTPRTIDIDILLYDDAIISTKKLEVPHPRMHLRRFVLKPLADIAPLLIHPVLNVSIQELLEKTTDQKEVFILASDESADTI